MVAFLCDRCLGPDEKTEINQIISRGDLIMSASLCRSRMREGDFRDFVDEVFIKPNPKPHGIHRIIADLGSDSFITTNYDHLIQDAYQSVHDGLVLFHINNDQPVEQARIVKHGASRFIFTPHGCAERCDSIVLTREDYRKLKFNVATIRTLQHLLISRPVIYLGFSLQDPDFLMVKDEIAATYKGAEREHFAIMPNVSDLQKRFWEKEYGINILSYKTKDNETSVIDDHNKNCKNHNELLLLLQDLHSILKERSTIKAMISAEREPTPSFAVQFRSSLIRHCEAVVHTFSAGRSKGFDLTATFRKDLCPSIELNHGYRRLSSVFSAKMPVQELLSSFGNLIFIGLPGAGKTHAVTEYAANLAENTLNTLRSNSKLADLDIRQSIPLVLSMKEYTGDVKEMIALRLPRSVDAGRALECGCLALVFDAINEVPRNLVETKVLADNISWLINRYPHNKFIFTTRTMNYVSFWTLPVFELMPISYGTLESYLKESRSIRLSNLHHEMIEILRNPLFLTLFVQAKKEERDKISNLASLLHQYFSTIEQKILQQEEFGDLPLMKLLTPIAYRMIDQGSQTVAPDQILASFHAILRHYPPLDSKNTDIFKTLISLDVLIPDAEGKVGFFHQSILEYLAAVELVSFYLKDPTLLKEKVNFLRWDEAILLFVSLLPQNERENALRQIADFDIQFACRAFDSATVKEKTIGIRLFDMISDKLSNRRLSTAEKGRLARAMGYLAPYGRKEVLIKLLGDPVLANEASIFLARMGVKEVIPKIIELLLKDKVWPSDFARALEMLADESLIPELIKYGRQAKKEELLDSNIAKVLRNFESDFLYSEVSKLTKSDVAQERMFAAEILYELDSDKARKLLAGMLTDSYRHVRWRAIFGLQRGISRGSYRTPEIVQQMFTLLADKDTGDDAAKYLRELEDEGIIKEAEDRLKSSVDQYERINLCAIIAKNKPKTSKKVFFDALDNYDPSYHDSLYPALASLDTEYIIPDILVYLKTEDAKMRLTVLEALRWHAVARAQLPLGKEHCEDLITIWETADFMESHIAGFLLADNCSNVSKDMLLKRLNDESYPFRERLIELVARLPLVKGDLSAELVEWLITKLDYETPSYQRTWGNPAAHILGKVCDETIVTEKLIPLLKSKNDVVRSNAFIAILEAERTLGKRFIKK